MKNNPWIVKTDDGICWRFESIERALHFYDILKTWGEQPSFPRFKPEGETA